VNRTAAAQLDRCQTTGKLRQKSPRTASITHLPPKTPAAESQKRRPPFRLLEFCKWLEELGFTVTVLNNVTRDAMSAALKEYAEKLKEAGEAVEKSKKLGEAVPGALGFFYYSGHGVANAGSNYLIPVDVAVAQDPSLWQKSYPLDDVISSLSGARNTIQFVVFDACRNALNLSASPVRAIWSTGKGFAPIVSKPRFLVAYSTAPGETASDGDPNGEGGPYAAVLKKKLLEPCVEAVTMFRNAHSQVMSNSGQDPWLSFSSFPQVYFAPAPQKDGDSRPLLCDSRPSPYIAPAASKEARESRRVNISSIFIPSGWMGDGAVEGNTFITYDGNDKTAPHARKKSVKINYRFGPKDWAGIYWQNTEKNWGDKPGNNYSGQGYSKITFWARGETGREVIDFKAGGINADDQPYRDSFSRSFEGVHLTKEWKQHSIDLSGADLSSVIGGFCWVAKGSSHPDDDSITFYLEDITLE
jgi:Caspase domain